MSRRKRIDELADNIPAKVREWAEAYAGSKEWIIVYNDFSYNRFIMRYFGCDHKAHKEMRVHEIMRKEYGVPGYAVRDLYCTNSLYGSPWRTAWTPTMKGSSYMAKWYNQVFGDAYGIWIYEGETKNMPNPRYTVINPEDVCEHFQYCGYSPACGDPIDYIERWKENSKLEFFGKLNLYPYPRLVKTAEKDKNFIPFLYRYHDNISRYGVQTAICIYKEGCSEGLRKNDTEAWDDLWDLGISNLSVRSSLRGYGISEYYCLQICKYIAKQCIKFDDYRQYLKDIKYIGKDLSDKDVIMPRDFEYRKQEAHDMMLHQKEMEQATLYNNFAKATAAYKPFEWNDGTYCVIVPDSISDLVNEGDALNHCVGKQGYDIKVIEKKSVIVFVRDMSETETPLVTVEISAKDNRLLQEHGFKNTAPAPEVKTFIDSWLEHIKDMHPAQVSA